MIPALAELGQAAHVLGLGLDPAAAARAVGYTELTHAPRRAGGALVSAVDVLQRASFYRRHRLASDRVTLWWYRRHDPWINRMALAAVESLAAVGSRSPVYEWQVRYLARLRRPSWDLGPARAQLEAIRPSLVVATSCINLIEEPYLLAAADLGIPTLGCIQSFDHLTGRSLPADCDHFAVWNARMREQLLRYHRVRDPSRVHLTGTAQFDFHVRPEFRWTRTDTLQRLGLEPGDRYILYAANTFTQTPTEPDLVRELVRRGASTAELAGHRFVVRLHPNDDFERWSALAAAEHRIVVSRPSTRSESFAGPEDQARLVSTLLHADVCHNMWSSMSLDSAVIGTPVVCVAFAATPGSLEDRFCREVYEADFYRPIVESGGVRMARTMDELVAETVAYAGDRSRDATARAALAAQECGPLDGRSAERIAALVARLASSVGHALAGAEAAAP
jgi:hypothetical protein